MRKHLFLILRPCATRHNGDLDDFKQATEKRRHLRVGCRFAFGERPVEMEYDKALHENSGTAISSSVTDRSGRKRQAPKDAGSSSTPPCRIPKSAPPNSTLPPPSMHTRIRGCSATPTMNGAAL